MRITTEYTSDGANNNYSSFVCELPKGVNLKITIEDKDNASISMEDSASGVVDISTCVKKEDLDALVRVFRNVSVEMQKLDTSKITNSCTRNLVTGAIQE